MDVALLATDFVVVGGAGVDEGTTIGTVTVGAAGTTAGAGALPSDGAQAIASITTATNGISVKKRDNGPPPSRTPGRMSSCSVVARTLDGVTTQGPVAIAWTRPVLTRARRVSPFRVLGISTYPAG